MNESTSHNDSQEEVDYYRGEEFRLLVDAVTEYAIFRLDPEGRVASWNAGAEKIKGYAEADILGQHFSVFYSEEDAEAGVPVKALESAVREGVWTSEGWRIRKDGTRFWADVTVTALFEEDGTLFGFAKVTRDMTDQHAHEQRLKQEKQRAERAKQRAEKAKQRAEREKALLQLMQVVAATANDADSLDEAMQVAVQAVCQSMNWPIGHVYRAIQEEETRFAPMGIWHLESEDRFGRFRKVSEETFFSAGESLPGRAATNGTPVRIRDVTADPAFARTRVAEALGVKGAFGIPVRYDGKTVAVLEFFSVEEAEPDEELLEALASVGVQLSRVAEREEARKAIRRSEERYRRLFVDAQEGIVISTPAGEFIDVNPAAQEMLGYSRQELMAMNVADFFADPQEREAAAVFVAREGAARNLELRGRHKSGRELILEVSTTVRHDAEGEVTAYQTLLRDITDRKKAQEALKESEAKFRALTERALVGIGLLQDGIYKYVNPMLAHISGYTQEELIGQPVDMLFHPSDLASVQDKIRQREAGDIEEAHYEARIVTKENEMRFVEIRGTRVIYRGKPGIIGMISDITRRKQVRESLKESEAKFRALSEKSPVGILLIQDGRLKYANEALAQMYGYAREELIGQMYAHALVHPSDRGSVQGHIERRLSGKQKDMHFRFRGLRKDGETIQVDAYGARIEYQGRPAIIGMDIDVTDRMRLQREVLSMQEEERRRLGRDLHDGVASQLTNIGLMVGLLLRRIKSGQVGLAAVPGQLKEIQERVVESGKDVRRLSRGLAPAGLSGSELPEALARLVDNIEGGRFEHDGECLPEQDETTTAHLYRIAQEAVTNAQKYAEADRITIRLRREDGFLVLESEDDGCGFDASTVEKHSLGLRTMRYRAELLGGTLTIDSAPGEGTCVRCQVPV